MLVWAQADSIRTAALIMYQNAHSRTYFVIFPQHNRFVPPGPRAFHKCHRIEEANFQSAMQHRSIIGPAIYGQAIHSAVKRPCIAGELEIGPASSSFQGGVRGSAEPTDVSVRSVSDFQAVQPLDYMIRFSWRLRRGASTIGNSSFTTDIS
jgi:hypothetical protein